MSRKKSRPSTKRAVAREPALVPPEDERSTTHRLTGKLRDTLEAITGGCVLIARAEALVTIANDPGVLLEELEQLEDELDQALEGELDEDDTAEVYDDLDDEEWDTDEPIDDEIGNVVEEVGRVALTTRVLARSLLARVMDRGPVVVPALVRDEATRDASDADAIDALVNWLLPSKVPESIRPTRAERRDAFEEAAYLVREVGLEEFDVSCMLDQDGRGAPILFTYPLDAEAAHVALVEYLFHRAETLTDQRDPLLELERAASSWEFDRWSAATPPAFASRQELEFARSVRELEYSLVERPTVTLGTSVMSEIAGNANFAELVPRQQRMAQAFTESFVDVFECVSLAGKRATLRSLRDGREYAVHEHMNPIEYATGWFAAGRLLPFDGDVHLRSPGMIWLRPEDPVSFRSAAAAYATHDLVPPGLALEGFISSHVSNVSVPRAIKPAASRVDARELREMVATALEVAALERQPAPNDAEESAEGDVGAMAIGDPIRPDATLQAFMNALDQQAAAGSDRKRSRARRRKKGRRR